MLWLYTASVLTSLVSVFVKIFQIKNVQGDHRMWAFFTSYIVAVCDVATIAFIVEGGWWIALSSGTGAAFGVVAAMTFHDRIVSR